ncbi:predicted protein [Histoplasma capsulatum H143]|uniref:Uncharacterized protein n=1 Tax=Ajellomyces capsulatus (strain H143) TaxID=544712 RepID=C6H7I1_AJECH|nr:predicted protein [Histoplasma capsulatum H143]
MTIVNAGATVNTKYHQPKRSIQKLSETWKGGHGYIVRDETRSVEDPKPVFNRATARISRKQQGGLAFSAGAKCNHNKKSAPRNKRTLLDVLSSWVCARGRYQEGLRAKSSTTAYPPVNQFAPIDRESEPKDKNNVKWRKASKLSPHSHRNESWSPNGRAITKSCINNNKSKCIRDVRVKRAMMARNCGDKAKIDFLNVFFKLTASMVRYGLEEFEPRLHTAAQPP